MIDFQIIFPASIFLPAFIDFVGCVMPRIVFPLSILMLLGLQQRVFNTSEQMLLINSRWLMSIAVIAFVKSSSKNITHSDDTSLDLLDQNSEASVCQGE